MERLYTLLAEYLGATYISQHQAETPTGAVRDWSELSSGKKDVPEGARLDIKKQLLGGDIPTPISGQRNVWCLTGTHGDQLILINVVLTQV